MNKRPTWFGIRRGYVVALGLATIVAGVVGAWFTVGPLDIKRLPFYIVGKSAPDFQLSPVKGRTQGLSSADLKGEVSLVNVFASWCVSCREEHPLLMELAKQRTVPIHGINYKDVPEDAAAWLDKVGDPFTRTGFDPDGKVGISLGVYGVPKTFVVDRDGRIAYRHSGPLNERILRDVILPMIAHLRAAPKAANAGAPPSRAEAVPGKLLINASTSSMK